MTGSGHERSCTGVRDRLPGRTILFTPTTKILTRTTNRPPATTSRPPATTSRLPATTSRLPATTNRLPATTSRRTLSVTALAARTISVTGATGRHARRTARRIATTARLTWHQDGDVRQAAVDSSRVVVFVHDEAAHTSVTAVVAAVKCLMAWERRATAAIRRFLPQVRAAMRGATRPMLYTWLTYSSRSSLRGSMESARRAGIQVASKPRSSMVDTTAASTRGSREVA